MLKWFVPIIHLVAAYLAGAGSAWGGEVLRVESGIVKWARAPYDSVTSITYSVLTGPYRLPTNKNTLSPDNCGAMRPFTEIVSTSPGLSSAMARRELRSAFAAWEGVTSVKFIEMNPPRRADIIVGATDASAGRAFANLSLAGNPLRQPVAKALGAPGRNMALGFTGTAKDGPIAAIEQAYVCLNPKMRWKIGFDGNLEIYDLRYTLMHEIGHAIGLDHPGSTASIMGYRYDERVRELQPSDIAAAQWLYGSPMTRKLRFPSLRN